ncbi:twisted gastrulation protein homolog 1-A-like [Spea bombifrons]|uniref:twisted gastrulation protein homolog 1-A-like n=1 Tax=Spea bombifrons TaxID=233779 RepID=UPI00234BCA1D|nr:twisted gastrulation protein homolog 1-A-like [Spea bombifrons]
MKNKGYVIARFSVFQPWQLRKWDLVVLLYAAVCCSVISTVNGCNKALCASDVSKCLLQELCQCQMKDGNCPCCQDCALCLDSLWEQCCDCVGLCTEDKKGRRHSARRSSLEELPVPVPSLFRALSGVQEGEFRHGWSSHSLPVSEELGQKSHTDHILLGDHSVVATPTMVNMSAVCTVMYFNPCMSMRRCHQSCESVGSPRYRWFHNGCCQCVGPDCYGYGSKEAMCQQCRP